MLFACHKHETGDYCMRLKVDWLLMLLFFQLAADVNTGIRCVFTDTVSGCIVHTKFHCHRCPPFSIQVAAVMELGKMLYSLT